MYGLSKNYHIVIVNIDKSFQAVVMATTEMRGSEGEGRGFSFWHLMAEGKWARRVYPLCIWANNIGVW